MGNSRIVIIANRLVFKKASQYEAVWTKYLAPNLFLGYKFGFILLRRIKGTLLSELTYDQDCFIQVAGELGKLHRKAIANDRPPIRKINNLWDELLAFWNNPAYKLSSKEAHAFQNTHTFQKEVDKILVDGVFTDANPRNWIITPKTIVAIDFGSVAEGSFSSDLAQLLDYYDPMPESVWDNALRMWAINFRNCEIEGRLRKELPIMRIYSALCRIPFHLPENRVHWYRNLSDQFANLGFEALSKMYKLLCLDDNSA